MRVSWEPNPCGAQAVGYSVYVKNSTFHSNSTPPEYSAEEVVNLGLRIVENTPFTEIIYFGEVGSTKSVDFAVIAHASANRAEDSSPTSVNVTLLE